MRRLRLALAALCCIASQAQAATVIRNDLGGWIAAYVQHYRHITNQPVEIDGVCASACTLVVGIVPRQQICVTPNAALEFHSASLVSGAYSEEGTREMWNKYPPDIRAAINAHGWDGISEHPGLVVISGEELQTMFQPCPKEENAL